MSTQLQGKWRVDASHLRNGGLVAVSPETSPHRQRRDSKQLNELGLFQPGAFQHKVAGHFYFGINYCMLDDPELEQEVRVLMYELMMVLYQHGIREVHVGGMMRLMGIDNDRAAEHDDEMVILDRKFAKYVEQITEPRSSDQTIH